MFWVLHLSVLFIAQMISNRNTFAAVAQTWEDLQSFDFQTTIRLQLLKTDFKVKKQTINQTLNITA